ncbi:hypothetical protein [Halovenus sp. HT40]|uniref:hypothetical protein n=1 Tax=Halovenus sp. HT40 TaxID=3126691 RepID=UPI00300EA41B
MSLEHPDAVRQYTCLACEDTVTEFQTECPSCGGKAFRTIQDETDEAERATRWVSEVTARANPYIPR